MLKVSSKLVLCTKKKERESEGFIVENLDHKKLAILKHNLRKKLSQKEQIFCYFFARKTHPEKFLKLLDKSKDSFDVIAINQCQNEIGR